MDLKIEGKKNTKSTWNMEPAHSLLTKTYKDSSEMDSFNQQKAIHCSSYYVFCKLKKIRIASVRHRVQFFLFIPKNTFLFDFIVVIISIY